MKSFDGKKIREEILADLKARIFKMRKKPGLAVIIIGENEVNNRYAALKKKIAERIGITVRTLKFAEDCAEDEVTEKIKQLNADINIDGIMVQMPVPDGFDKFNIVNAISPEKDVDGLRFCGGFHSHFTPPVVLSILKAMELADKNIEESEVVVVGRGFLVGWPVARCLEEAVGGIVIADANTKNLESITKSADVIVSATGKAGLIQPQMISNGVVLIDAGTSEVGGELKGDIDPACYEKASFYTPVPGGIGPVTIAMLLQNLVKRIE